MKEKLLMWRLLTDLRNLLVEEYRFIGEMPETPLMERYAALIARIDQALYKQPRATTKQPRRTKRKKGAR